MINKILDGRLLAKKHESLIKQEITRLGVTPKVVSILVGDDPASIQYTNMKQKKAAAVGINFIPFRLSEKISIQELIGHIEKLNNDGAIDGIMIQLPLPRPFFSKEDSRKILNHISGEKDIDGLTDKGNFLPAVVKAVIEILEGYEIPVMNKKAVILGASNLIGKPVGQELLKRGAKVDICNSKTPNVKELCLSADIIVAATGVPQILKVDMVSDGVVVIDVGAAKVKDKIVGDVDFGSVYPKASKITPVPGGVGPMTVVCLMENILQKMQNTH